MTLTSAQIATNDFADILFDTSNHATDIATFASILSVNSSASTQSLIANAIATSAEANIITYVYSLYSAVLGVQLSDSTMPGLKYWVQAADSLLTPAQVKAGTLTGAAINFLDQSFINAAASTLPTGSPTALVDLFFAQSLNNLAPDPAGVAYWVNQYSVWVMTLGSTQALISLVNSFANAAAATNGAAIGGVLSAGAQTDGSAGLGTGATYGTLGSGTSLPPGQTYILTTGADKITVTGNNATIIGMGGGTGTNSGATFTSGDTINGGSYTGNTLDLWDLATAPGSNWTPTNVSATVSGIQTINLTSAEAVTASTTKGFTGLTTLNVVSVSDGSAVDNIIVGSGTAVTVSDSTAAKSVTANLTVTGGSTVAIAEANGSFANGAKTITVAGGAGTTGVSVIQTESARTCDQLVSITDVNEAGGTAAGVITSVTIDGLDSNGASPAASIADNALSSLTINNVVSGIVAITEGAYASPATTLNLTLNNDAALTLNDVGSKYRTLAVTMGSTSSLTAGAGFSGVTSETITGSGVLTQTAAAMTALGTITLSGAAGLTDADLTSLAALTSVTATSSGTATVSLNANQTSFTGGTGQDIVTISTVAAKPIVGGSAGNNEIVLNNAASTWPTLANISNFQTLGVGPASSGTFDLGTLAGFTAIDARPGTGTVTFVNVATGSPLAIDGAATSITYQTLDSSGTTDNLAVTIGGSPSNASAYTIGTLAVTDAAGTGIATLNVTAYDTTPGAGHSISTLVDNSLNSLTINGTACVNIGGTAFSDLTSTLAITNNSSNTTASQVAITAPMLTSLSIGGSGATAVALTDAFSGAFSLTDTAGGAVTVTPTSMPNITTLTVSDSSSASLTIGSMTDANLTTLNLNNTGSGQLTESALTGNGLTSVNIGGTGPTALTLGVTSAGALTIGDTDTGTAVVALTSTLASLEIDANRGNFTLAAGSTSSATLLTLSNTGSGTLNVAGLTDSQAILVSLTGKVTLNLTDSLAGAVGVVGGLDNSNVTVNLNHSAGGQVSLVTLGNGNDTVIISDSVLTNTVAIGIGSGLNSITLVPGHTGAESITFTAANAGSTSVLTTVINAAAGDAIYWQAPAVDNVVVHLGLVNSIATGMAQLSTHGYTDFITASGTYIFENTGTAATNELVAIVGTHPIAGGTATMVTLS